MKANHMGIIFALTAAVLLVCLAASPPLPVRANNKEVKSTVDSIMKEAMKGYRIPSLTVAVVQNGKTVFQKAYGTDPLFSFAENATSNGYALGPASQVLTGGAILLLVGENRVGLDDPVSKYLPGLPEAWRAITIAHLLSHRSGLPLFSKEAKSFTAAVAEAAKQPLRFKPGSQRAANSADFDLLGQVVEKVSGETYLNYMDHTVFKQLKFGDTGDFSLLSFRFVKPRDNALSALEAPTSGMTYPQIQPAVYGGEDPTKDPTKKAQLLEQLYRGIPSYSIPSKGLASNIPDLLRLTSAIFDRGSTRVFNNPEYLTLAPGWKACDTGKDVLLTTAGGVGDGFGINLSVVPSRKSAVLLMWKIEKGSDNSLLQGEAQDILESALGLPVSTWICTSQEDEGDEDDEGP